MNEPDEAVETYLAALDREASSLPDEVRAELLDDVRAHLAEVTHRDPRPVALRQAMDDLGTPQTLVAAAREQFGASSAGPESTSAAAGGATGHRPGATGIGREVWAFALAVPGPIVALVVARALGGTAGGTPELLLLPPLIALLAGWVLIWTSRRWQAVEKALATALWPFGFAAPFVVALLPTQQCVSDGTTEVCEGFAMSAWIGFPLLLVLIAAPLVGTGWLFSRAQRHARTTSGTARGAVRTPTT